MDETEQRCCWSYNMASSRAASRVAIVVLLVCIAIGSFGVRMLAFRHAAPGWAINPDSIGYLSLANGLRNGCGFAPLWQNGSCGSAETERTPGYPLFLTLSNNLAVIVSLQAGLWAGLCLLIAFFAWSRLGLTEALIAELLTAFDLSSITNNGIGTEVLFTAIAVPGIFVLLAVLRRAGADRWFVAGILCAGFLLGAAALVRPVGQVLIIVIPLALFFSTSLPWFKRLVFAVVAVSVPLVMIVSWSARNYWQRGIWTFSTIGAVNLYYYRAAGVLARESGESLDEIQSDLLRSTGRASRRPDLWSKTFDQNPAELKGPAIHILVSHPLDVMQMTFKGFVRGSILPPDRPALGELLGHRSDQAESNKFLTGDLSYDLRSTFSSPWLAAIRLLLSYQLALTIFMWVGIAFALGRMRGHSIACNLPVIILLSASFLLLAAAAGPEMNDRFRVPAVPMLSLSAAFGWTTHKSQLFSRTGSGEK